MADVRRFEREFLEYLRRSEEGILAEIRDTGKLSDETAERLTAAIEEFKKQFTATDGSSVVPKEARAEAMDEAETTRETVKVKRPAPSKRLTMAAQIRVLRRRIRSTQSMKKITKAMELVATSRIAKAQARVAASRPYAQAITRVLTALANASALDHPLLVERADPRGPACW